MKLLLIIMLPGALYADECEDYLDSFGDTVYNCDCNEDTWQEYYPNMGRCWLKYADLSYANLYGASLNGAYLHGVFLNYANLEHANLEHANLEHANLEGAILTEAYLVEANLFSANLTGADLSDADLSGANLSCAILSWADLNYTNLGNTTWDECGITDENGDGYDDVSYEAGSQTGDVNLDGGLDILDLVSSVNMILDN